jgi:hypothetical protein
MQNEMTRSMIVILFIGTLATLSCTRGRMVSRPLTEEEMQIPPGRTEAGCDIRHTSQVDLPSPAVEPVFEWKYVGSKFGNLLVDGENGAWFSCEGSGSSSRNSITRLNADGSFDWEHEFYPASPDIDASSDSGWMSYANPAVACYGAVICSFERTRILDFQSLDEMQDESEPSDLILDRYLACIDIDGKMRWRTERLDAPVGLVSRIAEDKIVALHSDTSIALYSISSGELQDVIEFGANLGTLAFPTVLPVEDGWICFTDETEGYFVSRYDENLAEVWKTHLGGGLSVRAVQADDASILVNSGFDLKSIGLSDGSLQWNREYDNSALCAATDAGGYLVLNGGGFGRERRLSCLSQDGSELWSMNIPIISSGMNDVLVYNDGSILVGYKWGISLLNSDGSIRWTIDYDDMDLSGLPSYREGFWIWELCPLTDGGLIAKGENYIIPDIQTTIFKFSPPS